MSPNPEQGKEVILIATRFYYRSEILQYTQEIPNTITMDNMDKDHISDCNVNRSLDIKHHPVWNASNVKNVCHVIQTPA